jgi:hypothetical protein
MNYMVCQRLKLELLKSQIEIDNIEVSILRVDKEVENRIESLIDRFLWL